MGLVINLALYSPAVKRPNGGFTETAPFVGMADAGLGGGSGPIGWQTFQPAVLLWLYKYRNFDIFGPFLDHFVRCSQLCTAPRAPYDILY